MNLPESEPELKPVPKLKKTPPKGLLAFLAFCFVSTASWFLLLKFLADPSNEDNFALGAVIVATELFIFFPGSIILFVSCIMGLLLSFRSKKWPIWSTICVCFGVVGSATMAYCWIWFFWLKEPSESFWSFWF